MQEALQMIDLWGYLKIIDAYLNGRLDDKELMQQLGRTISRDALQLIIHFKANLNSIKPLIMKSMRNLVRWLNSK